MVLRRPILIQHGSRCGAGRLLVSLQGWGRWSQVKNAGIWPGWPGTRPLWAGGLCRLTRRGIGWLVLESETTAKWFCKDGICAGSLAWLKASSWLVSPSSGPSRSHTESRLICGSGTVGPVTSPLGDMGDIGTGWLCHRWLGPLLTAAPVPFGAECSDAKLSETDHPPSRR